MSTSIALGSTKGKDFTNERDGIGRLRRPGPGWSGVGSGLLWNVGSAGAHFVKNFVVWGMKTAVFGADESLFVNVIGNILRKSAEKRCGCA